MICYLLLAACNTTNGLYTQIETKFNYINEANEIAVWDINTHTISYSNGTIDLLNCDAGNNHCLEADWAKIVVPKSCKRSEFYSSEDTYKPQYGVKTLGLAALSGGINYFGEEKNKFGYTYHPSRGIISITLIPSDIPIQANTGFGIVPYVYNLKTRNGPFPCIVAK